MQEYTSKEALAEEIKKTAAQLIGEFDEVADEDSDLRRILHHGNVPPV